MGGASNCKTPYESDGPTCIKETEKNLLYCTYYLFSAKLQGCYSLVLVLARSLLLKGSMNLQCVYLPSSASSRLTATSLTGWTSYSYLKVTTEGVDLA